ncbi:hypothetical protein [Desulfogranum japonicum]|uniref:hypothetical protein n=1 Tax=Desulfogranum japonicum TaxID=231447 RepID=UPI0003F64B73|nr:hypothetical protein [Desulfogranum japonicum]
MKTDDGVRAKNGVVCSLREENNDSFTLILDDVININGKTSESWEHNVVFTWKEIKAKYIENLSESELADIGYNLIIRLLALNTKYKKQ